MLRGLYRTFDADGSHSGQVVTKQLSPSLDPHSKLLREGLRNLQFRAGSMRFLTFSAVVLTSSAFIPVVATPSQGANIFAALAGSWSGGGTVRLANGKSEKLQCHAYYKKKGESGLGIAIRCASPSNSIHMRSSLRKGGSSISGTWEERTFNVNGSVSGQATSSSLRLSISGSVSGSLSISLRGKRQTVRISTGGNEMTGVSLSFRRK